MERYRLEPGPDGMPRLKVPYRGPQLLSHPMYNKSTAFTREERHAFSLEGLLPDAVSTLEQQVRRAYGNIARKPDPLERYIGLAALQDRNETLFYRVLVEHLEEFLPIVYTPTVGRACQEFSHIFRRARGLWITPDDRVQGTAAVAVAGVMAASRLTGIPWPRQRVVIFGAGAAGVGIARLMRDALKRAGVEGDDLRRAIALIDTHGLVTEEGAGGDYRRGLGWPLSLATGAGLGPGDPRDLRAVIRALKPTVLIGVSGAAGAFTEEIVREMARGVERPLIFPLSNPTSQSEATPADVVVWSGGRALVATGSPFAPVTYGGRTTRVGQGNNVFIFPGVGLGALLAETREITEGMFAAAAERLAAEVRDEDLAAGSLFPPIADLRRVTAGIADAVVREARQERRGRPLSDAEIPRVVAAAMWEPRYVELEPA